MSNIVQPFPFSLSYVLSAYTCCHHQRRNPRSPRHGHCPEHRRAIPWRARSASLQRSTHQLIHWKVLNIGWAFHRTSGNSNAGWFLCPFSPTTSILETAPWISPESFHPCFDPWVKPMKKKPRMLTFELKQVAWSGWITVNYSVFRGNSTWLSNHFRVGGSGGPLSFLSPKTWLQTQTQDAGPLDQLQFSLYDRSSPAEKTLTEKEPLRPPAGTDKKDNCRDIPIPNLLIYSTDKH